MNGFRNLIIVLIIIFTLISMSVAQTLIVSEIVSSNTNSLLDAYGNSPDWIELYNAGDETLDLTSYWLSDDFDDPDRWIFTTTTIGSHDYLIIFASGTEIDAVHTNFSLNAGGEELVLSDPNGNIIDSVLIPALPTDVSYGREPNDGSEWFYFLDPTPAAENSTEAYDTPTPLIVEYSPPGGLYWGQVNLTLTSYFPEDTIYYTLDGSLPTIHSEIASATLEIYETSVVRARILSQGILSDRPSTHTYIIDKDTDLPVIAIAAEPPDLWDQNNGIYVDWESDREIPVHLEFYEPGGLRGFSQDAGMKMFGGWSRHFPQKSFALFARSEYGSSDFDYRIFPDLPFEHYEAFVLRNSGGDFDVSHIRDAMMQTLIDDINIDLQAYRPAVVYLNGEYWGILNVREKLNEHYIEAHHGVTENDLDMLENNRNVIHGNSQHYSAFLDYLNTHDMTLPESYDHVNMQIDLDEYLNYMVSEIYFANVDWPGWNLKYWRPRTTDGKWRWITYDLDDGFDLGRPEHYGYDNMIDSAELITNFLQPKTCRQVGLIAGARIQNDYTEAFDFVPD